jgi:hypothetical protein
LFHWCHPFWLGWGGISMVILICISQILKDRMTNIFSCIYCPPELLHLKRIFNSFAHVLIGLFAKFMFNFWISYIF